MMNLTHKARETFAKDLYATEVTGICIDAVEEDEVCCSLSLTERHRNAMGAVMGGALFTLADFVFAIAANRRCLAEGTPLTWVSLTSNIHYLIPPKGDKLYAKAICVKQGRATCIYNIEIRDDKDSLVALVTTTGMQITKTNTTT